MKHVFPFSAIVGQDLMKQALILNAINPQIGGVLIRGEKGTAKSTLVRALADLLPEIPVVKGCPFNCDPQSPFLECPFCSARDHHEVVMRRMPVVTLPANATEDRVAGTIDIEHALRLGVKRFEPGVLAKAHRGILYIDEVNLLDDHIVDLLLDAAAMGINHIEREGISFSHPSSFILIGTMNPEEGDLRPQLLDRFSLCVDATALMESDIRKEIIHRRLAWEQDPERFAALYEAQQRSLAAAITAAQTVLPKVTVSEDRLTEAAHLCIALDIRSHRADIVMLRTAMTIAAYDGRTEVLQDDIRQAARLCLPHRMRRRPFEESRLDPETIDTILCESAPMPNDKDTSCDVHARGQQQKIFDSAPMPDFSIPRRAEQSRVATMPGKGVKTTAPNSRGRYSRALKPSAPHHASDIAVDATLRAAAPDLTSRNSGERIQIQPKHIRVKKRTTPAGTLVLFVVDASGSMAASRRMAAAKGAVLNLLKDAYVNRNRVAMIAFRGMDAEVILPPTNNVDLAHEQLKQLPTGGRTPLAHGLAKALEIVRQVRAAKRTIQVMVVVLSDGKANVAYDPSSQITPFEEAIAFARQIVLMEASLVVLDTEDDFLSLGMAKKLAEESGAAYIKLSRIEAEVVEHTVRQHFVTLSSSPNNAP
ncbi:MAG: magnesium chelatase subunit D family protein [Desulfobacterota bacterium]|nr:magnesium chelatase subunit D family protein [Thermodesulfobacteriota bacterium]